MDVRLIKDPRLFTDLALPFMTSDPFTTNVIGVHVGNDAQERQLSDG
jgi:hypothetical protein